MSKFTGPRKERIDDLAVLGGQPAFAEPLHVGRPNIGDRERLLERIDEMLDRRWLTNDGPFVREFEAARRRARLGVRALRRDVQRHRRARDRGPRARA